MPYAEIFEQCDKGCGRTATVYTAEAKLCETCEAEEEQHSPHQPKEPSAAERRGMLWKRNDRKGNGERVRGIRI